ncbi:spore cortex biosynthesis protein YabQ [Peribacillus cavernae]|uniref:Spore cortex biosynthesis protein YabQ n=1 Tax=Peribacillus cavernae TaxID=1674310 RepID=A0A433HGG1_9BACI|nr:spore cortex biosynthesis protein YabQ [Peribacillus cavernae]MDQ0220891.1 spore cortex biosynthesis protein YabQ [Peribacillus cavernae]RUQ27293.1 spore cortex biosynthesis protein YabQ [Peribacillus cavernae]
MTLSVQFYTLVAMIGMGSYFGAALDTYNRFLKRSKRKSWLVFINDFLFWVVQGLLIFYVLFLVNEGELRFYLFLALLCGFSAYQALFKSAFNRFLESVIHFFITTSKFIVKSFQTLIYHPIKWLISGIVFLFVSLGKGIYSLIQFIFKLINSVLSMIIRPFIWILKVFWNYLPKSVTKNVGKFYNKGTGFFNSLKNVIKRVAAKWRNKSD